MKTNERQILYFFIFIALIFEWRLYVLFSNAIPLQGDEAQYWKWSTKFAWGYFSKPPLLAWVIALTTKMFSSFEAYAIRFASNFAYFLSLFPLFLLSRQLYNVKTACWSIVVYFTLLIRVALMASEAIEKFNYQR